MTEPDQAQNTTAAEVQHRRAYSPRMIGVLIAFVVMECLFLFWGHEAAGLAIIALFPALLFAALRYCRAYWGWSCITALVVLVTIFITLDVMFPAVSSARKAAQQSCCLNNMRNLGLALHNYHSVYGQLPPAFVSDKTGRPMHSWRTLLLPFIEQHALHEKYDFEKPWDSPENQTLGDESLARLLQCPSIPDSPDRLENRTDYIAVLGDDTLWPTDGTSRSFDDAKVDVSNVVMLIEINNSDIVWREPRDVALDDLLSGKISWSETAVHPMTILYPSAFHKLERGHNVVTGDGRVITLRSDLTLDQIQRLFSITPSLGADLESFRACSHPIVYRFVVLYLWLAALFMQLVYIFVPVGENAASCNTKAKPQRNFI